MSKIKEFYDLNAWKKAHALTLSIYTITKAFPPEEKYGLIQQMRRCSASVSANIAEGFKRKTSKDKMHFYNISLGSLEELKNYMLLSRDLGYKIDYVQMTKQADEAGRLINGLINYLKKFPY